MKNSWDRMRSAKEGSYIAKRDYERLMAIAERQKRDAVEASEADELSAMYTDENFEDKEQ